MEIPTAITLVERVIYKPGWIITAEDHSRRFEGAIKVHVVFPAWSSDRGEAEDGYPTKIDNWVDAPLIVGDCKDDLELYRRLLGIFLKIEEHEAREFLRVPGTHWAPFHPHKIDGMKAWRDTPDQDPALSADLTYGLS